ncbi:hypothetical protein PSHT_01488 [Puccinia striiformis]|uniref:Hydrophobin n=1 Tax=Puccinia striiformis TaxID=27350 RepID=A0A2S4WKB8_9BASI|nr:hypothetical protein PSHT_01488 [Puccinia striiformis]
MLYLQLFLVLCASLGVTARIDNPSTNPNPYPGFVCPAGRIPWCIASVYQNLPTHKVSKAINAKQYPGVAPYPGVRYDCEDTTHDNQACCSQQFNTRLIDAYPSANFKAGAQAVVFSDVKSFCLDPSGHQYSDPSKQ